MRYWGSILQRDISSAYTAPIRGELVSEGKPISARWQDPDSRRLWMVRKKDHFGTDNVLNWIHQLQIRCLNQTFFDIPLNTPACWISEKSNNSFWNFACQKAKRTEHNGLWPGWRQAIIWTNAGILLIGPLETNFNEILFEIQKFSFKKMYLKILSAKWRPFCLGLNVLTLITAWPSQSMTSMDKLAAASRQ